MDYAQRDVRLKRKLQSSAMQTYVMAVSVLIIGVRVFSSVEIVARSML